MNVLKTPMGQLSIGLGLSAAAVGYMVGGSATPVVSIAIPAIFAIVTSAFTLVHRPLLSKDIKELLAKPEFKDSLTPLLNDARLEREQATGRAGLILMVFSICYVLGTIIGTNARVNDWFGRPIDRSFVWATSGQRPNDLREALAWIALTESLESRGYSQAQIESLYSIPLATTPLADLPHESATPQPDESEKSVVGVPDNFQLPIEPSSTARPSGPQTGGGTGGAINLEKIDVNHFFQPPSRDPSDPFKLETIDAFIDGLTNGQRMIVDKKLNSLIESPTRKKSFNDVLKMVPTKHVEGFTLPDEFRAFDRTQVELLIDGLDTKTPGKSMQNGASTFYQFDFPDPASSPYKALSEIEPVQKQTLLQALRKLNVDPQGQTKMSDLIRKVPEKDDREFQLPEPLKYWNAEDLRKLQGRLQQKSRPGTVE